MALTAIFTRCAGAIQHPPAAFLGFLPAEVAELDALLVPIHGLPIAFREPEVEPVVPCQWVSLQGKPECLRGMDTAYACAGQRGRWLRLGRGASCHSVELLAGHVRRSGCATPHGGSAARTQCSRASRAAPSPAPATGKRTQSSLDDGVALSVEELQHRLTLVDAKAPCVRVGGWQRRRRHRGGGHGGRGSRRRPAAAAAIWRGAAAGSGQTPAPPPPQREGAQAVGKRGAARGGRGFWARGIARAGGRRRVAAKGPAVVQWGPLFGTPLSHIRGRCLDLRLIDFWIRFQ